MIISSLQKILQVLITIIFCYYLSWTNFLQTRFIHDDADILEASDESEMVSFPTSKKTGRWARATFKIVLSYNGGSFDGWQKQPGLKTVQG